MATYTFASHLHSARFNADWSEVTETYSTPALKLFSGADRVSYNEWGQIDGAGLYLDTPNGMLELEFEPVFTQRIKWGGTSTDVLQIAAHVRDGAGNVIGFDTYYIELGGTPLPSFGSEPEFGDFMEAARLITPQWGPFAAGTTFQWVEAMGLDRLDGTAAGETITGAQHDDLIYAQSGNDQVLGQGGNDTIYGGGGNDRIFGLGGNDLLWGAAGRDTLKGGEGHDTMNGGGGNDVLDGGTGHDLMTGGTGADTFVFAVGHGRDRVTDFNVAEGDRLQLDDALWGGAPLGVLEVISQFATFPAVNDRVVFTFAGGERLVLMQDQVDGLVGLHGAIDIL